MTSNQTACVLRFAGSDLTFAPTRINTLLDAEDIAKYPFARECLTPSEECLNPPEGMPQSSRGIPNSFKGMPYSFKELTIGS